MGKTQRIKCGNHSICVVARQGGWLTPQQLNWWQQQLLQRVYGVYHKATLNHGGTTLSPPRSFESSRKMRAG